LYVTYPAKLAVDGFMTAVACLWLAVYFVGLEWAVSSSTALICLNATLTVYTFVRKFAVALVYVGSMRGSQHQMGRELSSQRSLLIVRYGGERFKLLTEDGNSIDAMVFDQRGYGERHI